MARLLFPGQSVDRVPASGGVRGRDPGAVGKDAGHGGEDAANLS